MERNMNTERVLTASEVADRLHVHINTVRRWSNQGLIAAYRIGPRGDRRFRERDIDYFLTELNHNNNGSNGNNGGDSDNHQPEK